MVPSIVSKRLASPETSSTLRKSDIEHMLIEAQYQKPWRTQYGMDGRQC